MNKEQDFKDQITDYSSTEFLDDVFGMLQIMGDFIHLSMKMHDHVKILQHISYTDLLTKFGNRYAMNEYIKNMPDG